MKKLRSNSGYTLAPVMVIMVLVLALTGGAIANSVLNLQAQENAVKQMQGKYEAAGKIEEVYTKLKGITNLNVTTNEEKFANGECNGIKIAIEEKIVIPLVDPVTIDGENLFTVSVSIGTTAKAEFEVSYTEDMDAVKNIGDVWTHTITITSVTYKSFDVSYGGTGGGGS